MCRKHVQNKNPQTFTTMLWLQVVHKPNQWSQPHQGDIPIQYEHAADFRCIVSSFTNQQAICMLTHHHGSLSPKSSCFAKTHGEGGRVLGGRRLLNNLADCLSAVSCRVSFAAGMTLH